jgi:glyceraldehyde-3-phosphate dehydrogenase (NADP+)
MMKVWPARIGNELRNSDITETIENPYDGSPVGEVAVAGPRDMDDAIAAAAEAFEVVRRLPTHLRRGILRTTARILEARAEELAELVTRESGKPIRYARAEIQRAVITFDLGADETARFGGEVLPVDLEERAEGRTCFTIRVPRGPVAAISPFNFPVNLIAHKLGPAVAVGGTVVLKPPPQSPIAGHLLGEMLIEAGLPPGGVNVLHCSPETGQRMVEDPRMKVLSFTGSDAVGWKLKSLAGKKQVLLELGGNAPCVIDAGVDLDAVLGPIVAGAWAHAGQVCIKVQRIFVHDSIYKEFLVRFVEATRRVAVGDPSDPDTVVGPMIETRHVERVRSWIEEATAAGAMLHCGGEVEGRVMRPAVLTGVDPGQKICREEVFGPVTVIEPFRTFSDAVVACNAGRFGLQAGVFTPSLNHALAAVRDLEYGGVMINDVPTFRVDNFPYGGTKDSGFGREGVRYAMEEMSEPRVAVLRGLGG